MYEVGVREHDERCSGVNNGMNLSPVSLHMVGGQGGLLVKTL